MEYFLRNVLSFEVVSDDEDDIKTETAIVCKFSGTSSSTKESINLTKGSVWIRANLIPQRVNTRYNPMNAQNEITNGNGKNNITRLFTSGWVLNKGKHNE